MRKSILLLALGLFLLASCQATKTPQNNGQSSKEHITDTIPFTNVPPDIAPAIGEVKILQRSTLNNQGAPQTSAGLSPNAIIGELGKLSVSQSGENQWHSLTFAEPFQDPVVIMQPLSYNGGDPAVIRLRNVTGTGFEFQIDEWDYLNGAHGAEVVSYIAMETGLLINGLVYEVGKVQTNHRFEDVTLKYPFSPSATVLTQVQTLNGESAVTTRQEPITGGFRVKVQEEEASGSHTQEEIGYIAVLSGEGPFGKFRVLSGETSPVVSHNWHTINYDYSAPTFGEAYFVGNMQTYLGSDPAAVRYRNLDSDSVQVRVEEEKSADTETNHPNESVGYLLIRQAGFDESKLTAFDGTANDWFGRPVAISGDTVVVGAERDDDKGSNSGSAYIYKRIASGKWVLAKKILASDGAANDWFGRSVAISGDTVVVGAEGNDVKGNDSGSIYIFDRNEDGSDNWGEVTRIVASDGAALEGFGRSVAISGDTVVVGAEFDDDNGSSSGSAYIYEYEHGGAIGKWVLVKKILAFGGAANDNFGSSVAISGDTVVVGAQFNDSGSAYIFDRNEGRPNNWGEVTKILASDGAAGDRFGRSVAISGDTVVVGAYLDDDKGSNSGSAYIYDRNNGGPHNWGEVEKILASDGAAGDSFGLSVAISGDIVIIGASEDDDKGNDSGSAYTFDRNEGGLDNWGEVKKILASDGAAGDSFGCSVAISGNTVVVGAYRDDDNGSASGSVYIFE